MSRKLQGSLGPGASLAPVMAVLRAVSSSWRATPLSDGRARLSRARFLVEVDGGTVEAATAALENVGVAVELLPPSQETGAVDRWMLERLGCGPLSAGEMRWLVQPSFEPEWAITIGPEGSRPHAELRRSATSLSRELWEDVVDRPGKPVLISTAAISRDALAEAERCFDRAGGSPPGPLGAPALDGTRVLVARALPLGGARELSCEARAARGRSPRDDLAELAFDLAERIERVSARDGGDGPAMHSRRG